MTAPLIATVFPPLFTLRTTQNTVVEAAALLVLVGGLSLWLIALTKQGRRRSSEMALLREHNRYMELALSAAGFGVSWWNASVSDESRPDAIMNRMAGFDRVEQRPGQRDGPASVHPDDSAGVRGEFGRAIRDRMPYSTEYRVIWKDGSVHWMRAQGRPFYTASGALEMVAGASIDITERRTAEDTLQGRRIEDALRTEAKYRELVENANDVIFTVDREGYCLTMNPAGQAIEGYSGEGPRRTHLSDLVVPGQADILQQHVQRVLSGEEVSVIEVDVHHLEGSRVTLEVAVRPVFEGGQLVAAQGIARDVTPRKELEAQLRQAQKMDAVGQLAAGIAHDFNNLLTIILGNCEIIAPLLGPQDRLLQPMTDISTAAERAASLTAQLLAYSRRQIVLPRVLDLNGVITEIRRMLIRLIGEDIEVQFEAGRGLWRVTGDQSQLEQVIVNLAVNARDAMPQGGRLRIETANHRFCEPFTENGAKMPVGDYVLLTVTDTGVGMNEATLDRLYEPFFTTKGQGQGAGLGLATVYGIVKQTGGYIFADSARGVGTSFRVLLPRTRDALTPAFADRPPDQSVAGEEVLLIVEDEHDVRELLREYLAGLGYHVLTAASGDEGLELCRVRGTAPAVLVSDIIMPGMNGPELGERLRTLYPELKVLFVSGYTDNSLVRQARQARGTHFLQKPFKLLDLAKQIRELIGTPAA